MGAWRCCLAIFAGKKASDAGARGLWGSYALNTAKIKNFCNISRCACASRAGASCTPARDCARGICGCGESLDLAGTDA